MLVVLYPSSFWWATVLNSLPALPFGVWYTTQKYVNFPYYYHAALIFLILLKCFLVHTETLHLCAIQKYGVQQSLGVLLTARELCDLGCGKSQDLF